MSQELTCYSFEIIFVTILLYLVLSTFLHLAAITVVFSFDQSIAYLLIFFNWYGKVGLFFFFTLDSDSLYIFIFKLLVVFFPLTISVIIQ